MEEDREVEKERKDRLRNKLMTDYFKEYRVTSYEKTRVPLYKIRVTKFMINTSLL